jgi:hypothetical protein
MNELDIVPGAVSLRDPQEILKEATERANVLAAMVEKSKSYIKIGGKKHLMVEAWITLAGFYGCSARIVATEEVEYGGVFGFKARARVTHDATGNIIAEADAICMHDESNWSGKPLHQVLSMAETRATSKALAMKFRSVVVLSGFQPTPAEELDDKKKSRTEKLAPAPVLPYGKSAKKKINDPTVPDEHLVWMVQSLTATMNKEERNKRFDETNIALIDAIEAELDHREAQQRSDPRDVGTASAAITGTRKPLTDHAWRDLIIMWESEYRTQLDAVKEELGVEDVDTLPAADRWGFFDAVQRRIGSGDTN